MSSTQLRSAAAERARGVRQPGDRPTGRRCVESRAGWGRTAAVPAHVALREPGAGSETLTFTGHASVVDSGYEMWDWFGPYTEVVDAGAFDITLARTDLDVPLVLGHDQLRRLARTTTDTLRLSMDDVGLAVEADLDPADADVAYVAPKLRAGLIDEMSFAFRIVRGQWSPDWMEYHVIEAELHRGDVAIVGYGANPSTDAGLRAERPNNARARALLELGIAR